jgi:hypothetical protein
MFIMRVLTTTALVIVAAAQVSNAAVSDRHIRFMQGANEARSCLAERSPYPVSKFHDYGRCLRDMYIENRYLSDPEKLEAAARYIAAYCILRERWGTIDAKEFGIFGANLGNEINAGYDWGVAYLRVQGLGPEAVCEVVKWVRCDQTRASHESTLK